MRKLLKNVFQVIVIVAMASAGAIVCAKEFSYEYAPIAAFFGCGLIGAYITGVFDAEDVKNVRRHRSIKDASRQMRQAA